MSTQRWTALMVGPDDGILAPEGTKFKGHPEHYDRIDVVPAAEAEKLRAELAEWQELHVKQAELNADLRAELAESKKEIALLKTPNIVWDFDDPENSAVDSVADAVYQHIDWGGDINVGDVMTFLTARKLSNVTIRITSVNDDGEVTFEAIDAAMAGGE